MLSTWRAGRLRYPGEPVFVPVSRVSAYPASDARGWNPIIDVAITSRVEGCRAVLAQPVPGAVIARSAGACACVLHDLI